MSRITFEKKQKGYSLPQMLTATAVGAVLTGVATTNYWSAVDKSRITAELETFDRINEAVNVVLAADSGNTTFLTEEHRKLFQKIIPETGSELTYAIRSTWKGNDTEGNHQYALSLDVYPRYSGSSAYEKASLKSGLQKETVNGETYYLAAPFKSGPLADTSGYTSDSNSTYAVAVIDTSGNYFVLEKNSSSSISLVSGASVEANKFDGLVYQGVNPNSTLDFNPSGVQKIGLLAQALDNKVDGGSGGTEGRVQYDDTCTSGAENCYMHIYLVDRGFSYNEQSSGSNSWHDEFFVQNFKSENPKSKIVRSGQKQSTVILGKNGDS